MFAKGANYYNEFDPIAAQWLRNLIKAGLIAPGDVDERSILDVCPDDLRGYTQCHFFAGVGVWSHALRLAGWPDDRRVWTGSCPCQPFSAAGAGAGFADERHLWPAFHHLIAECQPECIFGEQVASSAVDVWIDLVHADLEALGYSFGSVPFPSAGVGAPHIRDRNYWVANANSAGRAPGRQGREAVGYGATLGANSRVIGLADTYSFGPQSKRGVPGERQPTRAPGFTEVGTFGWLADTDGRHASAERKQRGGEQRQQPEDGGAVRLADAAGAGRGERCADACGCAERSSPEGLEQRLGDMCVCGTERPGPTNGYWADADWLACRDGKWRPVEPGTFPLAHGATARVGRLRAYGNAINAKAAQVFIESYLGI